jgi:hypothetical protein
MTLKLHRPDADGNLTAVTPTGEDYRSGLASRRWDAAELANPEQDTIRPRAGVAFIVALAILTFVLVVAGYGSGFWS